MTDPGHVCPRCGNPRSPGARFCGSCGFRFEEQRTVEIVKKAQETVRSAESAVRVAESAVRTAGEVRDLVITPPAEWKVVIGDRLPEALAARAASAVESRVAGIVVDQATSALEKAVSGPGTDGSPRTAGPQKAPGGGGAVPGAQCSSCGAALTPGARFCGSCGAAVSPERMHKTAMLCPACGAPVRPGAKFCGSCGAKIGSP